MLFMNEYEVVSAQQRYFDHPVLGPATSTLANVVEWTNDNSDGWPYWSKPCRAAKRLQELIQKGDATVAEYVHALQPLKSFRTRHGADFEIHPAS